MLVTYYKIATYALLIVWTLLEQAGRGNLYFPRPRMLDSQSSERHYKIMGSRRLAFLFLIALPFVIAAIDPILVTVRIQL